MAKITITQNALDYLKQEGIADKDLILITDDGGGKYSMSGGACSIGSHFSVIWLDHQDSDYPDLIQNNQNLKIYTSKYDLTLLDNEMTLDYKNGSLALKGESGILDEGVGIGNGAALIKANKNVSIADNVSC